MMMDSMSVLSMPNPLILDGATKIDSSSLRTRAEMRLQYKAHVAKSHVPAASSHTDGLKEEDCRHSQGVGYECTDSDRLLNEAKSDTDLITNTLTSMTYMEQLTGSQSLDEQIIIAPTVNYPQPPPPSSSILGMKEQQSIQNPCRPSKKTQSVWSQSHRKERTRSDDRRNITRTPPSLPDSGGNRSKINSTISVPEMVKRNSTVPSFSPPSTVVDDLLMNRALNIRENLRQYEMKELAAEAERAAESGMEKFVGSASKYVEESPIPQTPKYIEGRQSADTYFFTHSLVTPQRSRRLLELDTLEFSPSAYFSNNMKKIKVLSLRNFSDVVPNFSDMHKNIRIHLERSGVDATTLPEVGSREHLLKIDTIESDVISLAPSVTSGSLGSFGSYAASSLKGVVELLGRTRSNNSTKSVPQSIIQKSLSVEGEKHTMPLFEPPEEDKGIVDKSASVDQKDFIATRRPPPLFPSLQKAKSADFGVSNRSINSRKACPLPPTRNGVNMAAESSDSDDSSVEVYGRKASLNISIADSFNEAKKQSVQSKTSSNQKTPFSRPPLSLPSIDIKKSFAVSFEDPILLRSCSPDVPDTLQKSQTTDSANENVTVLGIFDRIQKKFSVSRDDYRQTRKTTEADNKNFVSNYFYTQKDDILDSSDVPILKIDIDSREDDTAFCIGKNCGDDDMVLKSSCETLGQIVTSAFEWVSGKNSDVTVFSSSTYTGHYTENKCDTEKRVFVPPLLSERSGVRTKFNSVNDLLQTNDTHGEYVDEKWETFDCSRIVACDGFDFNTENENFDDNVARTTQC